MKPGVIKFVLRQKAVIFPSAFIVLNAISAKSYLEASLIKGLVSTCGLSRVGGSALSLLRTMPEDDQTHQVPAAL